MAKSSPLEGLHPDQPEKASPAWAGDTHPLAAGAKDSKAGDPATAGKDSTPPVGATTPTDSTAHPENAAQEGDQHPWSGANHPYASMIPQDSPAIAAAPPPEQGALVMSDAFAGVQSADAAPDMPMPIAQNLEQGFPIRFSTPSENQANQRQPDYFFTPEGKFVPNPNAQPSPDGSINVEMQSRDQSNKSLRDAIMHQTDMQKQAAKDMMRLYQKAHPGKQPPAWMQDLANAQPNLPDFPAFAPSRHEAPTPPPENGFVNRGVSGGHSGGGGGGGGDGGFSGFANNGGFDNSGYFKGSGGTGDGSLSTGARDSHGAPMGPGEQVQAKQIYDYLTDKYGLTPAQASGVLGNLQTESSFQTNAHNHAEGAIGLAQWEGPRRTALENFAAQEHKPVTDWHVQIDFMMHEMKTSETTAYAALKHAETPQQAAAAFDKYYERSSGEARGQRMANAESIFKHMA